MKCRHCAEPLEHVFVDLGFAPPSNAYLAPESLQAPEVHFPLRVLVCAHCWLVQTEDYAHADQLFTGDYAYFSSVSRSWLDHAARYVEAATRRFALGPQSFVVEVASNDGYLLRNFVARGIPCLGIEPTESTAQAARALGIEVIGEFFGAAMARRLVAEGKQADLVVGNNVFAHVPDINDFTLGLRLLLKPGGTVTLEFPHLAQLLAQTQFDTIYHEHFSYLSLATTCRIFERAGLRVFDVEELSTHGGSLRVFGCLADDPRPASQAVGALLARETAEGLQALRTYAAFQQRVDRVKDDFLAFLLEQKRAGRTIAAYGAAAKGNTLLNYAGVRPDLLPCVADAAPSKQGRWMPGSHIPIVAPEEMLRRRPDLILVLPWNLWGEVVQQLAGAREWGARFVRALPTIEVQ